MSFGLKPQELVAVRVLTQSDEGDYDMSKSGFGLLNKSVLLTLVLVCMFCLTMGGFALAEGANDNLGNLTVDSIVQNETISVSIATNTDAYFVDQYEFQGQILLPDPSTLPPRPSLPTSMAFVCIPVPGQSCSVNR